MHSSRSIPRLSHTALGCACAALALTACSPTSRPPHGVLLISIDSLRQDHVGTYGYRPPAAPDERTSPTLDALAADGVLFEDAYSTTSWTLPSHAALMCGLPDALHGVVHNGMVIAPELVTLAELFRAGGYRTGGFFSGPNVHPAFGFGQGFETYVDCSSVVSAEPLEDAASLRSKAVHQSSHQGRTSAGVHAAAAEFLDARLEDDAPFFCFVHWWDVHYDYSAPEAYVRRFAAPDYAGDVRGAHTAERTRRFDAADLAYLIALYDAEIRYTDEYLGQLLRRLDDAPWRDDVLVMALSDHGEEFFEHGRWGHQTTLYEEVVRIPLIARWPAGLPAGRRTPGSARLFDVYRTLAAAAELEVPDYVEGRDLFAPARAGERLDGPAPLHLDVPQVRAHQSGLVEGSLKVIRDETQQRDVYFDLGSSNAERRPMPAAQRTPAHAALGAALEGELQRWARVRATIPGAAGASGTADLDAALRAQLEAAGYLTDSPPDDDR